MMGRCSATTLCEDPLLDPLHCTGTCTCSVLPFFLIFLTLSISSRIRTPRQRFHYQLPSVCPFLSFLFSSASLRTASQRFRTRRRRTCALRCDNDAHAAVVNVQSPTTTALQR